MSFIEVKNVTKSFNGVEILKNLNMTIDEGKVLGILGRSGSGKSVLINMFRGMKDYRPDSGQILYTIAICPSCLRVEPPSAAGKLCSCGCDCEFEIRTVDFWNCDRQSFCSYKT